jgi:FtsZ-binding cell division protein ZapB
MTLIIIVVSVLTATTIILAVKLVKRPQPEPLSPMPLPDNPKQTSITTKVKQRPIDRVIDFINQDMQTQGYKDAQTNNDKSTKEQKINELIQQGTLVCTSAIDEYKEKNKDITAEIDVCQSSGLLDTVVRLKAQKEKYDENIKSVEEIQKGIGNKELKVYASYIRGFEAFQIAIAEGLIKDKND